MADSSWIPLAQIYMRQGINIGGFMYRQYTSNGSWELHLHAGGGVVSLRNLQLNQNFYVSTANVDSCDGFRDVDKSGVPDKDKVRALQATFTVPGQSPAQSGGLIPNQVRHEVAAPAVVTVNAPEVLEPLDKLTPEQKAAKAAHFAPVSPEPEPLVNAPSDSSSPNAYKSLSVPKPAKRKPGRPRKVVTQDPPVSDASVD